MKNYIFLLLIMIGCWQPAFAQADRMTPELLWSLGRLSLQDVSEDGSKVLYRVTYYDIEANKGSADLYLLNTKDNTTTQLTKTPESEHSAVFTPYGTIAYLKSGKLWQMNQDGSNAGKISEQAMNGFKISPDGRRILFIQNVEMGNPVNKLYSDLPKADARIIDDLMYRHWDSWDDYSYSNIFYQNMDMGVPLGEPVNIMNEPYDSPLNPFGGMEQINWSPDGNSIAYTCKKLSGKEYAQSTNSDIYLYNIESKKTTNISEINPGYDVEPAFSPDGNFIVWNSMEADGYEAIRNRIILYEIKTGNNRELTKDIEHPCSHPQWSADSKKIYYSSTRNATYHLYEMTIGRINKERQLTKGQYNYGSFIARKDGIVASRTSMSAPADLYHIDLDDLTVSTLTEVNKDMLDPIKLGKVEKRMVETVDNKQMLVWMIYPPDFDPNKKYPTLLYCQGGPQSPVSQFWSYRWNFQMMAANDYIIVAPNRRGLPGFGEEWNDQISGNWGGIAMTDLIVALDDAEKEPYVDKERLGAVGASFGGYSVYWLAGNYPKRFKSLIAHCGVFNMESWYGTTEELFFANTDLGGSYWQRNRPATYNRDSPHKFVQNWEAPILVIHNEKDFRVPISEGMQAFQAAQLQDVPSRFLYFPEENHWVLSPQNGILWQRVFFDWLGRSLKQP